MNANGHEPDSAINRRRILRAGGFALAGVTGLSIAGAGDAAAASGDNLVIGTANDSGTAGTALTSSTTDPGLWLSNAAGPDLRLEASNPVSGWSAELGDVKGTPAGPLIGVDTGSGTQTAYLVTSADLLDFATFLPMMYTVGPARVIDTRTAPGPDVILARSSGAALDATGRLRANQWIDVNLTTATGGLDGIAAYLNLTVTGSDDGGHAVVYAAGTAQPANSSVNWAARQTIANFSVSEIGSATGQPALRIWVASTTHVIVDITAIYGSLPAGDVNAARVSPSVAALRKPVRVSPEQLSR